jgi:hypothetical protein
MIRFRTTSTAMVFAGSLLAFTVTPTAAAPLPTIVAALKQDDGAVLKTHYPGYGWGYRGYGWGVGAGFLAGALIGGAIAAPYAYGGPYVYGSYAYPRPAYDYAYPAYGYSSAYYGYARPYYYGAPYYYYGYGGRHRPW